MTWEFLLAASLLMVPPDTQDGTPDILLFASVRLPIQVLAVEWQILDPREVRYVLVRQEDFSCDMNLLRRRYQELKDVPFVEDSARFPERTTVNEYLAFNRGYRQQLDIRQPGEPSRWWALREAIQETDYLYEVWDTVRDSETIYYYVTVRRQSLKKLRDMLGEAAYYSADLPPFVPTDRFTPVRQ